MQEYETADPERRSHLLKKTSTPIHVPFKPREGTLLAQFALEPHQTSLTTLNPPSPDAHINERLIAESLIKPAQ